MKLLYNTIKSLVFPKVVLAFQLYALTLTLPITLSILLTLLLILGTPVSCDGPYCFFQLWSDYFVTGDLAGIPSYRIHAAVLFVCFLMATFNDEE